MNPQHDWHLDGSCGLRLAIATMLAWTAMVSASCGPEKSPCRGALTREQAVALAEKYVYENGYAASTPVAGSVVIQPSEIGLDEAEVLRRRRGSLVVSSVGSERRGEHQWRVIFGYTTPREYGTRKFGRAVVVDECSGSVDLEHESVEIESPAPATPQ